MAGKAVRFVCPACRGPLTASADQYACAPCGLTFPIVDTIPDFRLRDGPYISKEADRAKARHLAEAARTRSFEELIAYYYSITPDDPPDLARRWTAHALADVEIASFQLTEAGLALALSEADARSRVEGSGRLLDVGCSTGGLLVAARGRWQPVGVDVALRWLVVGRRRLLESGVDAQLVCAGAGHLPFPDAAFDAVACIDTLEHVDDAGAAVREAHRASAPDAPLLMLANNRYAPIAEPQLGMWGVGYLPRRWQAAYVSWRRPDANRYTIALASARELTALVRDAGYRDVRITAAGLVAPHRSGALLQRALALYNVVRRWPVLRAITRAIGPRLQVSARR